MNKRTEITRRFSPILLIFLIALGCQTMEHAKTNYPGKTTSSESETIYSDTLYLPSFGAKNEKNDEVIKNLKEQWGDDLKVIQTTSDGSDFTFPERVEPRRLLNPFGIKERVVIRALIDENGNVLKAVVAEGENPELNKLTLQWVKRWKYKPMTYKGVAVRSSVRFLVNWED